MTSSASSLAINGCLVELGDAKVSVVDRGFLLGDGLFETMRAQNGKILFWHKHLQRLTNAALILRLPLPATSEIERAVHEVLGASLDSESVVRLTVTRGADVGRGLLIPAASAPTWIARATPYAREPLSSYSDGISVIMSAIRRNSLSPVARMKSLNYLDNILARQEAVDASATDAIMLNTDGYVACATASNIFMIKDEMLVTPPLSSGILDGITRECVCGRASKANVTLVVRPLTVEELSTADEVFLTNTVFGILPVTTLSANPVGHGVVGDHTIALTSAYQNCVDQGWTAV